MTTNTDPTSQAKERIRWLLDHQCSIPVNPNYPINYYVKSLNNLIEEAEYHYRIHAFEQSFILYSRYTIFYLKGLKTHPQYSMIQPQEHERIKQTIAGKALPRAEELKAMLIQRYAKEYEEKKKATEQQEHAKPAATAPTTIPPAVNFHDENEAAYEYLRANYAQVPSAPVAPLPTPTPTPMPAPNYPAQAISKEPSIPAFDRSQKPAFASSNKTIGSLRRVLIPNDITAKFLSVAERNTMRQIETCGILAGKKRDDQYIITHIVVPKQNGGPDSCDTEKEEEMLEYIAVHDLITLGWIHTHPTQTAFLSSVDLHTHLPYQMLMPEAIAIVVSPKFNETGVFSLTQDVGIPTISTCRKAGFHEHPNPSAIYLNALHANYDPGLQCQIADLRN